MRLPNYPNKVLHTSRSIYIPEEEFGIDKEVNKAAKKDKELQKRITDEKTNLVSMVTILLWHKYIFEINSKNNKANKNVETS